VGVRARDQLLEREGELAALVDLLEQARVGEGHIVLIEGGAGIGKTMLLRAVRDEAKKAGMGVLGARATELERNFPFAMVRQLFEPALHRLEAIERDTLFADAARPAAVVVGAEGERIDSSGELADPSFAVLNALYWLTSNVAEAAPLLLAVDDAHWADAPSLRFLRFLAPRLEDLPVMLVLAARPSEPGAHAELLDQLVSDPVTRVLRPAALSGTAVAQLVRSQLAGEAEDVFCAAVHEATGGNPFMLRELLVELAAHGSTGAAREAAEVRELSPASIQRTVLLRLARLPDDAGRVARAVAVLGEDAEPRQIVALSGLEAGATAVAVDALVTGGILDASRPLRFVHPLVRNAVYADIPGAEKDAAHRAAASLLQQRGAEPDRIAVHILATDSGGGSEAVDMLSRAAQRALDRGAPELAISCARRALAEPTDVVRRRDLVRQLITAAVRAGDRAALGNLDGRALDELTADPQMLMASADELSLWLFGHERFDEAVRLLERAKQAALSAGDYDALMRFQAQDVTAPTEKRPAWERYRGDIPPGSQAERLLLALEAWRAYWLAQPATTVVPLALRALDDGRIWQGQPPMQPIGILIYLLIRADELNAAEKAIDQFVAAARARGSTPAVAVALALRGELALARGEVGRAEPDLRAAVQAMRQTGLVVHNAFLLGSLVEVLVERGELRAAEQELESDGLTGAIPDQFWTNPVLHGRARLRVAQARVAEAGADAAEFGRRTRRRGIRQIAAVTTVADAAISLARVPEGKQARGMIEMALEAARAHGTFLALALAGLGRGNAALALADLYLRGARAWGTPRVVGIGLRATGVVRGGAIGIDLLREAVATLEDSPARLEHAKALADLGAALRRANRRADAREPLRAALEMARRGGALAVARRAHDELEATGEKLGPLLAVGVESLTPSERRIAELAAEGLTNRQIAQTLFLSVKTVESHLRGAYHKLDVSSRRELAAALRSP
jgi:DNA-binding CsgD family transcriptional regulator